MVKSLDMRWISIAINGLKNSAKQQLKKIFSEGILDFAIFL